MLSENNYSLKKNCDEKKILVIKKLILYPGKILQHKSKKRTAILPAIVSPCENGYALTSFKFSINWVLTDFPPTPYFVKFSPFMEH